MIKYKVHIVSLMGLVRSLGIILSTLLLPMVLPSLANAYESPCATDVQAVKVKDEVTLKITADSECSSIYALHIKARNTDSITIGSSPSGWFGGEVAKQLIIWRTSDSPILPGENLGNFVMKITSESPYRIDWSVADGNFKTIDWGTITIP